MTSSDAVMSHICIPNALSYSFSGLFFCSGHDMDEHCLLISRWSNGVSYDTLCKRIVLYLWQLPVTLKPGLFNLTAKAPWDMRGINFDMNAFTLEAPQEDTGCQWNQIAAK